MSESSRFNGLARLKGLFVQPDVVQSPATAEPVSELARKQERKSYEERRAGDLVREYLRTMQRKRKLDDAKEKFGGQNEIIDELIEREYSYIASDVARILFDLKRLIGKVELSDIIDPEFDNPESLADRQELLHVLSSQ